MNGTTLKRCIGIGAVVIAVSVGGSLTSACTQRHVAGGLLGGAAVGGAYEYQNKRALDRLEHQRASGRISEREYQRRRREIDDRSLIY